MSQAASVDNILLDLRSQRVKLITPDVPQVWREDPVELKEFVESEVYCNLPPLTPVQYEAAIKVLGRNPKKMFDPEGNTGINVAVLLWGKGAGKDYLTSILQLYCIYVILCLNEPQAYFNQAPGEPLDVVNVAYSANQAAKVYFTKFLERLKRCAWFKRHFDLVQSGRLLEKRKADSWGEVHMATTVVTFPGNIRAISESSENESYEGYNIIVWIMDEASAFKSAKKVENATNIYNTLKSSANTRFVGRWIGFVLSYPRKEDDWDFTAKLYRESLTTDSMYGSREFSWNVAPPTTYPGPKFTFVYDRPDQHIEIQVPEVLRGDFETDPEESLGKYCCMPGRSQGAFIELPGAIPRILSDRLPIFTTETILVENKNDVGELLFRGIGHRIVSWDISQINRQYQYVAHVDCGLKDDRAAVVLAHSEPVLLEIETKDGTKEHSWAQKVVEDAHVVYEPDRQRNLRVSLRNIESLLLAISDMLPLSAVTYDHWQSASSVETLSMAGIAVTEHNINRNDYNLLRNVIYSGDIDLISDPLTEYELSQLRKLASGNVDHPEGGSKDLADGFAGVVRLLLEDSTSAQKQIRAKHTGMPRPTTAFSHNSNSDFTVSSPRGSVRTARGNSAFPTDVSEFSLPDLPPLPFGMGSVGRARPRVRSLVGGGMSKSQAGPGDPFMSTRIKELK